MDDPARLGYGMTTKARILLLRDGDLAAARRLLARAVTSDDRTVLARVVAASYAQDPAEWQELGEVVTGRGDQLGRHVRLLHDVLCDVPRTGHGAAPRLRAAFDGLSGSAPPGLVAELCRSAAWLDLLHDYRTHVRDLITQEHGQGAVTYAASGYWFAAHDHYLSGEWDAAEEAATAGLDLCIRHDLELLAHDLRCNLGWLAAARGDSDSTRAYSRTIEQWAAPRGSTLHLTLSARNLALAALSECDYDTAYAQCLRVSPAGTLAPHRAYAPWMVFDLVEAAVHTGRTQEAAAHLAAADRAALADLTPRLRLQIFAARAMTAPDEDAVPLFKAALALPHIERWPFDHARVRLTLGELHRRRHRPGDARPELRRAADIFARVGATAWRRRAEKELRATGVAAVREAASHTAADPANGALTAQQLEVAQLAASGLSNKEIGERLYLSAYRQRPPLSDLPQAGHHLALRPARRTGAGRVRARPHGRRVHSGTSDARTRSKYGRPATGMQSSDRLPMQLCDLASSHPAATVRPGRAGRAGRAGRRSGSVVVQAHAHRNCPLVARRRKDES